MAKLKLLNIVIDEPIGTRRIDFLQTLCGEEAVLNGRGSFEFEDGLILNIYITRPQYEFDVDAVREMLSGTLLGTVVLIDSAQPTSFDYARQSLQLLQIDSSSSYVIALYNYDHPDAWDLAALCTALRVPDDIWLVPCIPTNLESVKNVLLTLCKEVLKSLD